MSLPPRPFSREMILDAIPHRPPFLFVDTIDEWLDERIVTQYTFSREEYFFAGHYPGRPIVPGVILCESAMQAGAILLAKRFAAEEEKLAQDQTSTTPPTVMVPVVGRMGDVKFKRIVSPGETIRCEVSIREKMGRVYFLDAKVTVGGAMAVRFEFACTQTAQP